MSLEQLENEVVREERKTEKAVCEGDKKGEREMVNRARLFRGQSCLKCLEVSEMLFCLLRRLNFPFLTPLSPLPHEKKTLCAVI